MDDSTADYRLSPAFAARLVGLGLVLLALVVFAYVVVSAALGWPPDTIVVVVVLGLVGVFGGASWLRSRAYVVRLTATGYDVRFVRGAGVARGRWDEVSEAAVAHPRDVPCVVLTRTDGTTTSIPVGLLAADRDDFANDVRDRLAAARREG
ncbi:hypothetical protein [Nocardioides litoris]|uniref:hypothetical protein n=1 Tax=Nocardioides litoris TaxID=1926648 RepID=UPI0011233017|nr:hypothetical protein [Nocardioides litoris]